jgi:hypothetical protein
MKKILCTIAVFCSICSCIEGVSGMRYNQEDDDPYCERVTSSLITEPFAHEEDDDPYCERVTSSLITKQFPDAENENRDLRVSID